MIYLESFTLPDEEIDYNFRISNFKSRLYSDVKNLYPWGMFENRKPERFTFSDINILYGGNGSGKSTLLNLITQKLELARTAHFNSSPTFEEYLNYCKAETIESYDSKMAIRRGAVITSDDVFKNILGIRERIREYEERRLEVREEFEERKWSRKPISIDFTSPDYADSINELRTDIQSKNNSRSRFVNDRITQVSSKSNGENALKYFIDSIKPESLTLLDEPENSLSPQWQMELAEYLYGFARAEKCQLIIASHSPFILSIPGARIYNLDSDPISVQPWYELENMRCYFDLFNHHRPDFL